MAHFSNTASEFEFRGEDPGYEAALMEEMRHVKLSSSTKPNTKSASKVSINEVDSRQQLEGQWYRKDKEEPCSQLVNRQKGKKVHLGLDARKPVFGGLRTTHVQTSLRIRAV